MSKISKDFLNKWNEDRLTDEDLKTLEKLDWIEISTCYGLQENFIREFEDRVDWGFISQYQVLSEDFIKEFNDKVDWELISSFQFLSESFIREFKDEVDWGEVSINQILSWNFILEFEDRVDWDYISAFQPYINPNCEKINRYYLNNRNTLYHLYQKTKDKGWFIGYLCEDSFSNVYTMSIKPLEYYSLKAIIYWRDLKSRYLVGKNLISTKIIRKVKYV